MKKLITLMLFVALGATAATAQLNGAEIKFKKEVHDYGTVMQNGDGKCEFAFTNTGDEPLIIKSARGSCNCTVPQWPKEPIKPGETGIIKVEYGTHRVGPINKTVTVSTNSTDNPTVVLRIKGVVKASPTAPSAKSSGPKATN